MRAPQKGIEKAEFAHNFQCGRMNRIAAKIAQEVSVFFEHDDIDALAGEQKPCHHSRRSSSDDRALCRDLEGSIVCGHVVGPAEILSEGLERLSLPPSK